MSRRRLGTIKHTDPGKQADVITTRGDIVRGSSGAVAERLAVGSANEVLTADGTDADWGAVPSATDTVVGGLETATQAEQETGTAVDKIVTPGRQHFHQSAAKAWVKFNGTGTPSVDASFNITDITDNATGDYTVNIATDFSSADYGYALTSEFGSNGTKVTCPGVNGNPTAGTFPITIEPTGGGGSGNTDVDNIGVIFFGDQA